MTTLIRAAVAALTLTAAATACTPSGSSGLLPATHVIAPMDSGGGLPPGGHSATTPAPSPTP